MNNLDKEIDKIKLSKNGTLHVPVSIIEAMGIKQGDRLVIETVENHILHLKKQDNNQ